MTVEAKLARLLTEHEAAFTAGRDQGVQNGDTATLYRVFDVPDPDTGKSLGEARLTVVRFKVYSVNDKFCLGRVTDTVPKRDTFGLGARELVALTEGATTPVNEPNLVSLTPTAPRVPVRRGDRVAISRPAPAS